MRARVAVPARVHRTRPLAQILGHQFVFRGEVPVQCHFISAGGVGDGVNPDRPDSVPIKQFTRGCENTFAGRNSVVLFEGYGAFGGHLSVSS